jgi:signal transduction histidine kinase
MNPYRPQIPSLVKNIPPHLVLPMDERPVLFNNADALEQERLKIGHELHDSVNPLLAVSKLYIELIHATTKKEKFVKSEAITTILEAIENIRRISSSLVLSQHENMDLSALISKMVKRIKGTSIFNIHLKITGKKQMDLLSCQHKLTLYRIVQEQLTNIIKYSRATMVDIIFSCNTGQVRLSIKDDGVGFNSRLQSDGIGFANMKKRLIALNGFLSLESLPGNGCTLVAGFTVF